MRTKNHKGSGELRFRYLTEFSIDADDHQIDDITLKFASPYLTSGIQTDLNNSDLEGTLKSNDGKYTYDVTGIFNPATQCFEIRIFDSNN